MKIIIAGSRDFNDYDLLKNTILPYTNTLDNVEIVSGTAKGADMLGEKFALEYNYNIKKFPANWSLGKHAGILRNIEMADYADSLIAFWDGKSRGTKHMIETAKTKKLNVKVILY